MKNKLIIIGASGHGKVVADIALKIGYKEILFLDDNPKLIECGGYQVIGLSKDYVNYVDEADFFVGIGNSIIRERIMNMLKNGGANIPGLIHPCAVVGTRVNIGEGTVVMAGSVINSDTEIGRGCIINTCASCDHDNVIGDFSHISVGARLAGTVQVGKHTWIGVGAVVSNNLNIVDNCVIGAGTVVVRNIDVSGTYIGVPARRK